MLPYSAETFFAFLEQYNRSIWPAQVAGAVLGAIAIGIALRCRHRDARIPFALLTVAWLSAGIVYFLGYLWAIDFVAPVFATLFVLQGLLLVLAANRLSFRPGMDWLGRVGLAMALVAVLYDPLLAAFGDHGWSVARVVGFAPAPTVALTIALLLMCGRVAIYLLAIPVIWSIAAVMLAWFLGIPADVVLPLASMAGALLILWRRWRGSTL
jgi:hypothetical protein